MEKIIEKLKDYFSRKAEEIGLEAVFLFGSYAHGFEKEESDIDIAAILSREFEEDRGKAVEAVTELSYEVSVLTGREAQVILIDKDFSKPMLFYNAIVHGIPVYISNKDKHISLVLRALEEMEAFSLFGTKWQIELAAKRLEASV
jgi:predicted nucleotidyltransferase